MTWEVCEEDTNYSAQYGQAIDLNMEAQTETHIQCLDFALKGSNTLNCEDDIFETVSKDNILFGNYGYYNTYAYRSDCDQEYSDTAFNKE